METYAAYALARCLFGFLGGCFAYGFWQRLQLLAQPKSGVLMSCVEIAAVALIAVFITVYAYTPLQFLSPLVFGAAILIFAFEAGMVSKLLSLRPFVLLGELSFSIYMTHSLLREVLRWSLTLLDRQAGIVLVRPAHLPPLSIPDPLAITGGDMSVAILLLLFLTATLLFSLLTRRMIEQPGQALFGRLANSISRRPAPLGFPVPDKAN
jgi:peptidoglycan/LPS O-acetylase OafA/YrhL